MSSFQFGGEPGPVLWHKSKGWPLPFPSAGVGGDLGEAYSSTLYEVWVEYLAGKSWGISSYTGKT